MTVLTRTMT